MRLPQGKLSGRYVKQRREVQTKKAPGRERFAWFVSLRLIEEMKPAAGPGPGGFV